MASITAYPLTWPAGWKRAKLRSRANFGKVGRGDVNSGRTRATKERLTVAEGVQRLLASLRRMGVPDHNVVVSTNVQVRLDGLPYSNQREPSDPGVAVYWTKNKKQSCMAIDRYDKVADNLAAIAASLEAMRAIERYGGAEILERAFLGFQALPPPINGGRPWWDVLEFDNQRVVLKDAEDRYVILAHRHHPDHGGNSDKMAELNAAIRQAREVLT